MSDPGNSPKPLVSRRAALTAAVGIGATVAITSVSYVASAKEEKNDAVQGPVVVHVRDLQAGRLEIFTAGKRIEVKDKELAEQLIRAAARA